MSFLITALLLGAFWLVLSGYFDPVHLIFGALSVLLVSALSHEHLFRGAPLSQTLGRLMRLLAYLPWLLWQILLANVDVTLRVLGVRRINPGIIRVKPELKSEFATVSLANSITLTPGTVTVEIEDGEFIIHAISPDAAKSIVEGTMIEKIRVVAGEGGQR